MLSAIRFRGGENPGNSGGFATPHVAGLPEDEPDGPVNDSLGSVHPADTMDTDPKEDPKAAGKGESGKGTE